MRYRLLQDKDAAPGSLAQKVYILSNESADQVYGCVPNGGIGLSLVTNGNCFIKKGARWEKQPDLFLYGLVRQVQWHKITPGYREVTIVLKSYYLQLLFKERLSDLPQNEATHLYDLFDKSLVDELYEKLCKSLGDQDVLAAANCFLARSLQKSTPDPRVVAAHELICEKRLRKVEAISSMLSMSPTRLRDLFREFIGIAPKDLIKIRRINESFRVREHNEPSLTSLAYRLDYFDQSHFIHDFKNATGITPKQYFSNEKLTFDFYNFGRWDRNSFV